VTKLAPQKALKLIAWDKLTFEERVVLHLARVHKAPRKVVCKAPRKSLDKALRKSVYKGYHGIMYNQTVRRAARAPQQPASCGTPSSSSASLLLSSLELSDRKVYEP
jgi:hypothetical protein